MTDTAELTKRDAAIAFAKAWNNLDPSHLEPLLADDVHYAFQNVSAEMTNKAELMDYLAGKMDTIRRSPDARVWGELSETRPYPMAPNPPEPCALMAQGSQDGIDCLVLFKVANGRITRIDLCSIAPHPSCGVRTGIYPK